jgi:hypothetical protein
MLWGKIKSDIVAVNLDFSGLEERAKPCRLNEQAPEGEESDYYFWSPSHPLSDTNCLFGHVAQYHRKKVDANCYNGRELEHMHNVKANCSCTRLDFECDYNYEKQKDGTCSFVEGSEKPEASAESKPLDFEDAIHLGPLRTVAPFLVLKNRPDRPPASVHARVCRSMLISATPFYPSRPYTIVRIVSEYHYLNRSGFRRQYRQA